MIAVVGGTGTVGSIVVEELARAGKQPLVLSRRPPAELPQGAIHRSFDMSRADPAPFLEGAEVLVDLANSSIRPGRVLLDGTSRLLESCAELGVGHFVGISIIGCEKVGLGYYEAKTRQEELIRNSAVPWSLLKATQFHEFLDSILSSSARFLVLPGGEIKLQPIAAAEVGARLSRMALSEDARGEDRIAGPEVATLGKLAAAWKSANARRAVILKLPLPGSTGRNLRGGALTDPGTMMAGPAFPQWLKDSRGQGAGR